MNNKDKIFKILNEKAMSVHPYYLDDIAQEINALSEGEEEHGLARIKVEHCDCKNCVVMRTEIAKRVILQYLDEVEGTNLKGAIYTGIIDIVDWLDQRESK